ncbi:hypothetical protein ACO0QE_003609 [Hanseniaspora vineae]
MNSSSGSTATTAPNLDRTKSYQNCREADVPGYNDCPIFLFDVSKKAPGKDKIVSTNGSDVYASAKQQTVLPPPPIGLKRKTTGSSLDSCSNSSDEKATSAASSSNSKAAQENNTSDEQVSEQAEKDSSFEIIAELLHSLSDVDNTKLSLQEFQYYKQKLEKNTSTILQNEHYRTVIAHICAMPAGVHRANAMNKWVISEPMISSWLPAFRKLLENKK